MGAAATSVVVSTVVSTATAVADSLRRTLWPDTAAAPELAAMYVSAAASVLPTCLALEATVAALDLPGFHIVRILTYTWVFRTCVNLALTDATLRLHLVHIASPATPMLTAATPPGCSSCQYCASGKVSHRIEEVLTAGLHGTVGTLLFVVLPWWWATGVTPSSHNLLSQCAAYGTAAFLHVTWRAFQHAQTTFGRVGVCMHVAVSDTRVMLLAHGAVHALVEVLLMRWRVFTILQTVTALGVAVVLDARAASPLHVRWPLATPVPTLVVRASKAIIYASWQCTYVVVAGYAAVSRRQSARRTLAPNLRRLYELWTRNWAIQVLKRVLIWQELRTVRAAISTGPASALHRKYVFRLRQNLVEFRGVLKAQNLQLTTLSTLVASRPMGKLLQLVLPPQGQMAASVLAKLGTKTDVCAFVDVVADDLTDALNLSSCVTPETGTGTRLLVAPSDFAAALTNADGIVYRGRGSCSGTKPDSGLPTSNTGRDAKKPEPPVVDVPDLSMPPPALVVDETRAQPMTLSAAASATTTKPAVPIDLRSCIVNLDGSQDYWAAATTIKARHRGDKAATAATATATATPLS